MRALEEELAVKEEHWLQKEARLQGLLSSLQQELQQEREAHSQEVQPPALYSSSTPLYSSSLSHPPPLYSLPILSSSLSSPPLLLPLTPTCPLLLLYSSPPPSSPPLSPLLLPLLSSLLLLLSSSSLLLISYPPL